MKPDIFSIKSAIKASAKTAFEWHEKPGALQRLTPPWQKIKIISQGKGIQKGTKVKMFNSFFGVPVRLEAEHTDYEKDSFFQDTLTKSPFKSWVHKHFLIPTGESESLLEDRIEFTLPFWYPWFMKGLIKKELTRIFTYRHLVFKKDIERHAMSEEPLTILISGASGLLGSALIPFLSTGGHRVITLVRRKPDPGKNELQWNPALGELDLKDAGKIDVVINLNGSPLADKKWTEQRKKEIIDSRTLSTRLLAEKISELADKPALFFSASAIGYYGECGDKWVTENDSPGDLFISDVCKQWEAATHSAEAHGIRTVHGRIGVVLTPNGGAIERMIPGFYLGLGARLSSGRQHMSFISMEDTVGAIWHIIMTKTLSGAVNIVAPAPVTNRAFTKIFGKVLCRPARFIIPKTVIRLLWGKMGEEILLSGAKVKPEKLLTSGYDFCHETLEEALRMMLGKFRD